MLGYMLDKELEHFVDLCILEDFGVNPPQIPRDDYSLRQRQKQGAISVSPLCLKRANNHRLN